MAIIQKITYMMKKKFKFVSHLDTKALRIHGFNPVIQGMNNPMNPIHLTDNALKDVLDGEEDEKARNQGNRNRKPYVPDQ